MISFRKLFGLRRRVLPRVAVGWKVEVEVPGREGMAVFYTMDAGVNGLRLVGDPRNAFARELMHSKRVRMVLHLPEPVGPVEVEAEMRWESEESGSVQMGFRFVRIPQEARERIESYIEAHPEDVVKGKG